MKSIFQASRHFLLSPKSPAFNSATARAFKSLPHGLRTALRTFERANRGHRHQLDQEVLRPALPGSEVHPRRNLVCETSNAVLTHVLALTDLPDDPTLASLFDAKDELGWLARHAELRAHEKLRRRAGMPLGYVLEDFSFTQGGSKCQMTLVVHHRRSGLIAGRTVSMPAGYYNTLRQAYATIRRVDQGIYDLLAEVDSWPQFVEAERGIAEPAQPLLDLARVQLQQALNPFTLVERKELVRNWLSLCPDTANS